jgi:hypothetical protein
MAIAVRDGWLACVSVCLCCIHRNLQKCIPSRGDVVSGATLLNWRMNVANLPRGMMKSLAGKDNPIESVTTRRLSFLHEHDVGCGVTFVSRVQSAGKGRRYQISVVIR